ncbi:MAG: two-component regulator propeller domain-containing protein [Patescibacteria group bacterium]
MKKNLFYFSIVFCWFVAIFILNTQSVEAVFSSTPLEDFSASNGLPNDDVKAIAVDSDGSIYIGGRFTTIGGVSRTGLAKINSDGTLNDDFNPVLTYSSAARVESLVLSSDENTLYFGGVFTAVGGVSRYHIAAVNTTNGALTSFDPHANFSALNSMALSSDGSILYVGGYFTQIYSTSRNYLAAINVSTEAGSLVTGFNPNLDNYVNKVLLSPDDAVLYFAGAYDNVGGTARSYGIASVYTSNGSLTDFYPTLDETYYMALALEISSDGSELFIAGNFTGLDGIPRNRAASYDITDENNLTLNDFNPNLNQTVYAMKLSPDEETLILGGYFGTASGSSRSKVASFNTSDGLLQTFNPNMSSGVYYVFDIAFNSIGNRVYTGGDYVQVGGNSDYQFLSAFPGPSVTLSESTQTVTEEGITDTYTVVLNTQPTNDVVIAVDELLDDVIATPTSLTFTGGDWDTPQTVTITAIDDDIDELINGDIITHVAASSDTDYNGISIDNITVTVTDNDTAGITVGSISGNTSESVSTATFTVVLDTEPTNNVTIPVSSSDTGEGTVFPSSLTFTSANWNTPQTITVTGVDDDVDDGDQSFNAVLGITTSSDSNYNNLDPSDVSVTNTDDDDSIINASETTQTVTEGGSTDSYTIVLTSEPTNNVEISISETNSEISISPEDLLFTSANWSTPLTVTITAVDDEDIETSQSDTISHSVSSADSNYNNYSLDDISVSITDNDEEEEDEPESPDEDEEDENNNGIPDKYEEIDPTDTGAVDDAVDSVSGIKKGKIKIIYEDETEVELKIFNYKKKKKTKIRQINNTGYIAALHPLGKQLKVINILNGDTHSSKTISKKKWTKAVALKSFKLRKKTKITAILKSKKNKINLAVVSLKNNYKLGKKVGKTFKSKKTQVNKTKKKKNKILIKNKKNKILKKFLYTKKKKLKLL